MRFPLRLVLGLLACLTLSSGARAASFTYDLTCVLDAPGGPCQPGPSFGTINIADTGVNKVSVTVDLLSSDLYFANMVLNFKGTGFNNILSSDGETLTISPSVLLPYLGFFDIRGTDFFGWSGQSVYTTTLSGTNKTLTAGLFNDLDTGGKMYGALTIGFIGPNFCNGYGPNSCQPGQSGLSYLNVGAVASNNVNVSSTPEPGTFGILGAALVGLGIFGRRRLK